jgi:hypothetical protein
MVLVILAAFVATVWVRRQQSNLKNLGHYNGERRKKLFQCKFSVEKFHTLMVINGLWLLP